MTKHSKYTHVATFVLNQPEEFLNITPAVDIENPLLFAFTGMIQVFYESWITKQIFRDYNTEWSKVFYDKTVIDDPSYTSEEVTDEKECVKMCLEDENCNAFEYRTEIRTEVSSCLLIKLQKDIMMEYSFNLRHTGSVDQIVPIFVNFDKILNRLSWNQKILAR